MFLLQVLLSTQFILNFLKDPTPSIYYRFNKVLCTRDSIYFFLAPFLAILTASASETGGFFW